MDSDQVARLLVELGERTPRIESIVQDADAETPRWAIELEDGFVVLAELDGDGNRLSLEADLGKPPEMHRLATCEALMMFTSLQHASNGLAMALTEPEGEFQLCGQILLVEPPPESLLQSTLIGFADHAQHWREIVAYGAQQDLTTRDEFENLASLA